MPYLNRPRKGQATTVTLSCLICDEELKVRVSPEEIELVEGCSHAEAMASDHAFQDNAFQAGAEEAQAAQEWWADLRYDTWKDGDGRV